MVSRFYNSLDRAVPGPPKYPFEPHATTAVADYDLFFEYPVFDELRGSGVVLRPFVPSLYGRTDYELFHHDGNEVVFKWLPYGPFPTYHDYLCKLEELRSVPHTLFCAIFNTAEEAGEEFVGTVAYSKVKRVDCCGEIGHIRIVPTMQRTHVASQVVALMLEQAFEVYKMRRVQWFAHASNELSQKAAARMGFRPEGLLRWERVISFSKAQQSPELIIPTESMYGSPEAGVGRHSALLAMGWDDWASHGVREQAKALMERPPVRRAR